MGDELRFNIQEAKNHLSRLLARAHAGDEIIICKAGKPYARLTAIEPPNARELGLLHDLFSEAEREQMATAILSELEEDELAEWYRPVMVHEVGGKDQP